MQAQRRGLEQFCQKRLDGTGRVIAYGRRSLQPPEQSDWSTRLEMLAIVEFVDHFRYYLLGRCFTARTKLTTVPLNASDHSKNPKIKLRDGLKDFKNTILLLIIVRVELTSMLMPCQGGPLVVIMESAQRVVIQKHYFH